MERHRRQRPEERIYRQQGTDRQGQHWHGDHQQLIINNNGVPPTSSAPPPTPPLECSVPNNLGFRGIANPEEFIGRDDDLQDLHELLQTDDRPTNAPTVVQLVGMAGLGKTELAIQYGRLHLEDYRGGIVWCAAATLGEDLCNWMQINLDIDHRGWRCRIIPSPRQSWHSWQRMTNG